MLESEVKHELLR